MQDSMDERVRRAWAEEAKRRYEELLLGEVEAVPLSDVLDEIEKELGLLRN